MEKKVVAVEDLQQFKVELLKEIKKLLVNTPAPLPRPWLKSYEVQKMLKISPGTLQHLRDSGAVEVFQGGWNYIL